MISRPIVDQVAEAIAFYQWLGPDRHEHRRFDVTVSRMPKRPHGRVAGQVA